MHRMGVRAAALTTTLTLLAVVSACSVNKPEGIVSGHFLRVGGPAPGAPVPLSGRITFTSAQKSVVIKVARDGAYTAHLAPGRYAVTGTSPQIQGGDVSCSVPTTADVVDSRRITADVICSIR
jgi:hypothetical protein